jgi:tape measure domain-containing protein
MATEKVEIRIDATDKASPVLKDVASSMGSIDPAAKRAGAAADPVLDGLQRRGAKAADGIKSISEQLAFVQKAVVLFQGGNVLTGLIKDVAETADEYANLAARIKLATGEGEAFDRAMEGVTDIALRTNSSLQNTGNLFARLTEAGKSAGQSAQEAQEQALSLTESINQAVQLSGASAQASDAAVVQLIQGLQSGLLRGEEFNSMMEQSPRLARALADGLGVTTGELRKMANEGRLTTEVVTAALKSQSDTLKSEFETLPPTIGRAVQNLATSWTIYVGEADKATGASQIAATAIGALADNLDTVAGYLIDAGQAAAGFAALRLAQTFLGIGAAAGTAAVATAAATASTVANTAAQVQNAAATRASDLAFKTLAADVAAQAAALGGNTAATLRNSAASATAAASAGRFAAILGSLKTFSLIGILMNFQDIGTWIGESAAKLAGYKDRTDELAQAERSRNAAAQEGRRIVEAQAAANKAALDSQFQLTSSARSSLAAFDDLVKGGKSAAEAVSEIGKDFDLASQPGIVNAAAVLDKLQADGKISAEQFKQAWVGALKGEDLVAFEVKAKAALDGTARESERVAAIMDASLREAIRRSGADFDVLSGGMSKAAISAINDTDTIIAGLDRLKGQGVDVGKALEASLEKGIKTADSQVAVDALRSRIQDLRKELGDKVADGLLSDLEEQAKKATGALGGLDGALKKLGITSDTELKKAATDTRALYEEVVKTGGSAREQAQAFERMASAAIASGDTSAIAFAKSQAAARGFEVTTDSAGKTIVRSLKDAEKAAHGAAGAIHGMRDSIQDASAAAEEYVGWAERMAQRNADVKSSMKTDGSGFAADASGNRIVAGGELTTLTGIANFLKQAGLDDVQAKSVAREFSDSKGEIPYFSNPGQMKYGGSGSTMSEALLKAAERTTFGLGSNGAASVGDKRVESVSTTGRPINMTAIVNGKRHKASMNSQRDAESMVRALEDAASRS